MAQLLQTPLCATSVEVCGVLLKGVMRRQASGASAAELATVLMT